MDEKLNNLLENKEPIIRINQYFTIMISIFFGGCVAKSFLAVFHLLLFNKYLVMAILTLVLSLILYYFISKCNWINKTNISIKLIWLFKSLLLALIIVSFLLPKNILSIHLSYGIVAEVCTFWFILFGIGIWLPSSIKAKLNSLFIKKESNSDFKKRTRFSILLICCILIPFWQSTFALVAPKLDDYYAMKAGGGLYDTYRFNYFYYYLNLFPLSTSRTDLQYDKDSAELIARSEPSSIESGSVILYGGDYGRIWMFLPAALLRGDVVDINVVWINACLFCFALIGVLIASWYVGRLSLGIMMVVFIGSHPFQLHEIFAATNWSNNGVGNIFALNITITMSLLALYFPIIFNKRTTKVYLWGAPIISGVILATARQIRTDTIMVFISIIILYIITTNLSWLKRFTFISLIIGSFLVVSSLWVSYFDYKINQANNYLESIGGTPFYKQRSTHHTFWHPVFCGLGDFDNKYGYRWDDTVAFNYYYSLFPGEKAITNVFEAGPIPIWYTQKYDDAIRDKVLHDITTDPQWYANILYRRILRIFTEVSPVTISIGAKTLIIPVLGILFIPFFLLLISQKYWGLSKMLLFTLPLSVPAFLIYSGDGMTYYAIFLQCCLAILGYGLLKIKWSNIFMKKVNIENKMII